jgi:hypothetical protein
MKQYRMMYYFLLYIQVITRFRIPLATNVMELSSLLYQYSLLSRYGCLFMILLPALVALDGISNIIANYHIAVFNTPLKDAGRCRGEKGRERGGACLKEGITDVESMKISSLIPEVANVGSERIKKLIRGADLNNLVAF